MHSPDPAHSPSATNTKKNLRDTSPVNEPHYAAHTVSSAEKVKESHGSSGLRVQDFARDMKTKTNFCRDRSRKEII